MKSMIITLAMVLSLSACGGTSPESPGNESPPASNDITETIYLDGLRDADPTGYSDSLGDSELISLGRDVCGAIDRSSVEEVFNVMVDTATNSEEAEFYGTIAGSAVAAFCPQFEGELNQFVSRNSI